MGRRFAFTVAWVGLAFSLTRSSRGQEARAPTLWYRASESCPTAADFVGKLADGGHPLRLAQAGDHIDFVVTLQAAGEQALGRLERQTDGGTIAIRELHDATCERVADALALSLGLAVDPRAFAAAPEPAAAPSLPAEPAREPVIEVAQSHADASPVASPIPTSPANAAREQPLRSAHWSVGLSLGALYGIATHPVARGDAFVTFEPPPSAVLPDLSLRLGLVGAYGTFSTPIGAVQRTLLAVRAEACPVRLGGERLALRPCLASELGVTRVAQDEAAASDSSLWFAPGLGLRGEFGLSRRLRLEASASGLVPIPRHEIFAADAPVYRDAIIVVSGALGVSFLVP